MSMAPAPFCFGVVHKCDMLRLNHLVYSCFKVTLVCFILTVSLACLLYIQGWTSVVCVRNKVPCLLAVALGRYITSGNILLIAYSTALFLMSVLLGTEVQLASGSTKFQDFFPLSPDSFRCACLLCTTNSAPSFGPWLGLQF